MTIPAEITEVELLSAAKVLAADLGSLEVIAAALLAPRICAWEELLRTTPPLT